MITLTVILAFLRKLFASVSAFAKHAWNVVRMQKWETLVALGVLLLVLVLLLPYCDKKKTVEIEDTRETITIIQGEKDARIKKQLDAIDDVLKADDAKLLSLPQPTPRKKDVTAKELEEKARGKK